MRKSLAADTSPPPLPFTVERPPPSAQDRGTFAIIRSRHGGGRSSQLRIDFPVERRPMDRAQTPVLRLGGMACLCWSGAEVIAHATRGREILSRVLADTQQMPPDAKLCHDNCFLLARSRPRSGEIWGVLAGTGANWYTPALGRNERLPLAGCWILALDSPSSEVLLAGLDPESGSRKVLWGGLLGRLNRRSTELGRQLSEDL